MNVISNNELGSIVVNKEVISKIIAEEMRKMEGKVTPCGKNGNILSGVEASSAVEISEHNANMFVEVSFITKFGVSIKGTSEELFDRIEDAFAGIGLETPVELIACIRGVKSKRVAKRNIEVVRSRASDPNG